MHPYVQLCLVLDTDSANKNLHRFDKVSIQSIVACWWISESRKIEATASMPAVCLVSRSTLLTL